MKKLNYYAYEVTGPVRIFGGLSQVQIDHLVRERQWDRSLLEAGRKAILNAEFYSNEPEENNEQ